jgi:hypothetical protein
MSKKPTVRICRQERNGTVVYPLLELGSEGESKPYALHGKTELNIDELHELIDTFHPDYAVEYAPGVTEDFNAYADKMAVRFKPNKLEATAQAS